MRKNTAVKIANFAADFKGMEIVSYKFHNITSERYPSWSTLKKYNVVTYVKSEFIDAYVDENVTIEIRYYKVNG